MTVTDIDDVARIEAVSSPDPWSRSLLAGELDLDESVRWWAVAEAPVVAEAPAVEIVGFVGLMFTPTETHVLDIAVDPARRRGGVASQLMSEAVAEAAVRQRPEMTLEVRAGNEVAIALYAGFGFEAEGRRPGYYPNGDDALILWRR